MFIYVKKEPKEQVFFWLQKQWLALLINVVFHAFVHLSFALNYNAMHISFILSPLVKGLCNYLMGTNYSSKAKRLKIDMCPHTPKIRLTLLEARLPSRRNLKTDKAYPTRDVFLRLFKNFGWHIHGVELD